MFKNTKAFSGFTVSDIGTAKKFYSETLGIETTEDHGLLTLHLTGGGKVLVYPRHDHVPAAYTVLNFPVQDMEKTVRILKSKGIQFEPNGNPQIAWFKDPAGNLLSVMKDELAFTGDSLRMTKFIPMESERVFKAWSTPSMLEKWSTPTGMKLNIEKMDFKNDGSYLVRHVSKEGQFCASGTYKKIIPGEKIVYTVKVDDQDGRHVLDTLLSVDFQEKEWGTEITLLQEGFTNSESVHMCEQGWTESLEKLRRLLVEQFIITQPVNIELRQ